MKRTLLIALVAAMVVLAGCGATTQGSLPTNSAEDSNTALEPTSGTVDESAGTIAFYISDEPAAIEDFEHLNVTIEKVGLKKQGAEDPAETDEDADAGESDDDVEGNETADADEDAEGDEMDDAENEAMNETAEETEEDAESSDDEADENETAETDDADDEGNETAEGAADESNETDEAEDKAAGDGWVTYEVDNRTVDLTELKGENATRLANLTAPKGNYSAVFVYVSDVEGVLKNGEEVNVKLPSQKLQLHTNFEVGQDANTDFVYDIAVHQAGKSGKYILKPNIAESGTDVPMRDIDRDDSEGSEQAEGEDEDDEAEENEDADEQEGVDDDEVTNETGEQDAADQAGHEANETDQEDDSAAEEELTIGLEGNVSPGETVTATVTDSDGAVQPGVEITVNDESVGKTDADGAIEFTIPADAEELHIEAEKGQLEGELEREFEE